MDAASVVSSEGNVKSILPLVEETRVTAVVSVDSSSFPIDEEDMVEACGCADDVLASIPSSVMFLTDKLSDESVDWSVVNTAGLGETMWLLFITESSVTDIETSGFKSAVTDLLVRRLVTSSTYVEALLVIELWTCEAVTCLEILCVFIVFDNCSLITVIAGLLMVYTELLSPRGL